MSRMTVLAAEMYARAHDYPDPSEIQAQAMWVHLPRGLSLLLTIQDKSYHLCISRASVLPSAVEERIVKEAFQVPPFAARVVTERPHAVQYTWPADITA